MSYTEQFILVYSEVAGGIPVPQRVSLKELGEAIGIELLEHLPKPEIPCAVKKIIRRADVAKKYGVSLVTVNDWANKNIIRRYRLGSRVYFYEDEVEAALLSAEKGGKK